MSYGRILGFVTLLMALTAAAALAEAAGIKPADQAFQFHAEWAGKGGVRLGWTIAPGHYLYRDRITATIDSRPVRIETEAGELKEDPNFGPTEVYHLSAAATVAPELASVKGSLIVTYQGCAENTICYPPISKTVDLSTLLVGDAAEGDQDRASFRDVRRQRPGSQKGHPGNVQRNRVGVSGPVWQQSLVDVVRLPRLRYFAVLDALRVSHDSNHVGNACALGRRALPGT